MKRKISVFLLVLLLLGSGFFRDFVMVNINHVLKHLTEGAPNFSTPSFYGLLDWKVSEINQLKWTLTILFLVYFWLISAWLMKVYFTNRVRTAIQTITILYAALLGLSGALYIVGAGLGLAKTIYPVVRTLTGISHSFIPAMLAFLYLKYLPEQQEGK